MVTFWERAAHSVNRMFSFVLCIHIIIIVVITHFDFQNRILVLIVSVPGYWVLFTFIHMYTLLRAGVAKL